MGMGLDLEFVKGKGPVIGNAISRPYDVDMLATPPAEEIMGPTLRAIELATAELAPLNKPLIGFAGAPFTLASYAIEGGGSKTYTNVKRFIYSEPAAWRRLMNKLVTVQADYLRRQVEAGAAAVQVFDSWAGLALGKEDYIQYVQPYNTELFAMLESSGAPRINFSTGTAPFLEEVVACGGDVVGVDWRMPLNWAWQKVGYEKPIQGNLDPVALLSPWREMKYRIDQVLDQAAQGKAAGGVGHIFNLGHGIHKTTPVEHVQRLVEHVREQTRTEIN
jgi:uroporphyrinogen decarboxylase